MKNCPLLLVVRREIVLLLELCVVCSVCLCVRVCMCTSKGFLLLLCTYLQSLLLTTLYSMNPSHLSVQSLVLIVWDGAFLWRICVVCVALACVSCMCCVYCVAVCLWLIIIAVDDFRPCTSLSLSVCLSLFLFLNPSVRRKIKPGTSLGVAAHTI